MMSKIAVDYGIRLDRSTQASGRCVQDFINEKEIPAIVEGDLEKGDDLFLLLRSNTVSLNRLRELELRTYPPLETVEFVSNKRKFASKLSQIGILGPSTSVLPGHFLDEHPTFLSHIDDRWVIKPNMTLGEHRGHSPQVSFYPFTESSQIQQAIKEYGIDFVRQRLIRGNLKKVFAMKPDVSFEYGYWSEDHLTAEKGVDRALVKTESSHPIIKAKMSYLLSKFGLLWSGIDYVDSDNGRFIQVIDMNPTNGGRMPPMESRERVKDLLEYHMNNLSHGLNTPEVDNNPKHRIIFLAAGKNERLSRLVGNRPKSLLSFGGKTVLERVMNFSDGIKSDEATLLYPDRYKHDFLSNHDFYRSHQVDWREAFVPDDFEHTPANDALFTVKPNEIITLIAADRVLDADSYGEIYKLIDKSLNEIKYEEEHVFTLFAIPKQDSRYSYYIRGNGEIADIVGPEDIGLSPNGGRYEHGVTGQSIQKFALMIHGSKIPFLQAGSIDDIVRKMVSVGVKGKVVLLPGVKWMGDLDTEADYRSFEQVLGKGNQVY